MDWGLFSVLASFLLPLALAFRVAAQFLQQWRPIRHPLALLRIVELALLSLPLTAAAPGAISLLTGEISRPGRLAIAFMTTPWGIAKLLLTIIAVLLVDAAKPRLLDQLDRQPASTASPSRAYLTRDLGVIVLCLLLAWAAASWGAR